MLFSKDTIKALWHSKVESEGMQKDSKILTQHTAGFYQHQRKFITMQK